MEAAKNKNPSMGLQDSRYGRFGLWAGIAVAVAVHLLLFVIPSPKVSGEKEKETERGVVARAYRPAPAPLQGAGSGGPREQVARKAKPIENATPEAPLADAAPMRVEQAETGQLTPNEIAVPSSEGTVTRAGEAAGSEKGAYRGTTEGEALGVSSGKGGTIPGLGGEGNTPGPGTGNGAPGEGSGRAGSDWDRVLAMLEDKKTEIQTREQTMRAERQKQTATTSSARQKQVEKKVEEDNFLDSRIRMNIASYPPTAIEKKFPAVSYPDLRFRRSELEAGICRVYYRVWIGSNGKVTRTELKTPADSESRQKYEPFITAVKKAVDSYNFDAIEAQIHIDVLFEIK